MARKPRLHISQGYYFVTLQSNAGRTLFQNRQDAHYFYELLEHGVATYHYRLHAFCLMPQQVFLLIQVGDISLSNIMHNISFRYTRWLNRSQPEGGHVFAGRYQATLLEADEYLLPVLRYIHIQPVRAGLTEKARDYLWSSHRCYLQEMELPWLCTEEAMSRFAADREHALMYYKGYILAALKKTDTDNFLKKTENNILANEGFRLNLRLKTQALTPRCEFPDLLRAVCKEFNITQEELKSLGKQRSSSYARGVLAMLVKQQPNIAFTDMARFVQRDATTLSAHATRIEKKCKTDRVLAEKIKHIQQALASSMAIA